MFMLLEVGAVARTKYANNADIDKLEMSGRANRKVGKCATAPAALEAPSQV